MASSSVYLRGQGLACQRNERCLFRDIDFELHPGQALQIVGTNGCGKTSLIRMICGLLPCSAGDFYWGEQLLTTCRSEFYGDMHYIGHKKGIKLALTPLENLRLQLSTIDEQKITDALAVVGLRGFENVVCWQLSAGQQQRVALAVLWLSSARLWILDEPFTAIDQTGIAQFEEHFEQHIQQGGMLLLTTHHRLQLPTLPVQQLQLAV